MKQKVNYSKESLIELIDSSRLQAQRHRDSLQFSSKDLIHPSPFSVNGFKVSPFFFLSERYGDSVKRLGWYILPYNSPCIFYFTCPKLGISFAKKYSFHHTPSFWINLFNDGLYSFEVVAQLIDDNPLISFSYEG